MSLLPAASSQAAYYESRCTTIRLACLTQPTKSSTPTATRRSTGDESTSVIASVEIHPSIRIAPKKQTTIYREVSNRLTRRVFTLGSGDLTIEF